MNENVLSQLPPGLHNTYVCAYIHSVYKESPRHYLSIEIKDHKFWKFKAHFHNHHSSKSGHITVYRIVENIAGKKVW